MITEKAYAKINLALDVTGKREDGYHLVKMVMQTLDLCDTLTFENGEPGSGIVLVTDDETLNSEQADGNENLIVKAARVLLKEAGTDADVNINLSKKIPIAAGMAGGSSDAAATFRGLNKLLGLKFSNDELKKMAVSVGADVPFCIEGGIQLAEGIGDVLTVLKPLGKVSVLICKPDISVATKTVYKEYDSRTNVEHPDVDAMVKAINAGDLNDVFDNMGNVLETVTAAQYPVITDIEASMLANGAMYAYMTGSGPTVFGIFSGVQECKAALEKLRLKYSDCSIYATEFQY